MFFQSCLSWHMIPNVVNNSSSSNSEIILQWMHESISCFFRMNPMHWKIYCPLGACGGNKRSLYLYFSMNMWPYKNIFNENLIWFWRKDDFQLTVNGHGCKMLDIFRRSEAIISNSSDWKRPDISAQKSTVRLSSPKNGLYSFSFDFFSKTVNLIWNNGCLF